MDHIQGMLKTHPRSSNIDLSLLSQAASELVGCAQTCTACADACLGEDQVQNLRRCIRTCLDCADVCVAAGSLISRQTESDPKLIRSQLEACVVACRVCAEECERHASHHEHCRICGESCRRCEQACDQLTRVIVA
jgi:hypothetical protein